TRRTERLNRQGPKLRAALTVEVEQHSGTNFCALAAELLGAAKAVPDSPIRRGLLERTAQPVVAKYHNDIQGGTTSERMEAVARLMGEREVPFEVNTAGELPVLSALACPYPELAKLDRSVCTMEKLMLSEMLGENVKLSACRL